MGRESQKTRFHAYREQEVGIAPYAGAARALGVVGGQVSVRDEVEGIIERRLGKIPEISEETRISLKEVLTADIRPFLRDSKGEISMLDARTLGLTTPDAVKRFLRTHNFDLENKRDLAYMERIIEEATNFYDEYVRESRQKKISPELKNFNTAEGICRVFTTSAGEGNRHLIPMACALLRIAATINYMEGDPYLPLMDDIEKELEEILHQNFQNRSAQHGNERKEWYFMPARIGSVPMQVVDVEVRRKTREEIIAKLLRKAENRIDSVLDRLGFRVCTSNASDAMKLFYHLFFNPDTAIFPGHNIRVTDTKNVGINMDTLRMVLANPQEAEKLFSDLSVQVDDTDILVKNFDPRDDNKFSSPSYRALHAIFDLELWIGKQRINFPIEVQIVDLRAKNTNEKEAPHAKYKEEQKLPVRARVAGNNLRSGFEEQKRRPNNGK